MGVERYLYHGTNDDAADNIQSKGVNLKIGRKDTDFGQGFYLAQKKGTAVTWAKRIARYYGGKPVLLYFTLDSKGLNIEFFKKLEEWAENIVIHRLNKPEVNGADLMIGPIADGDTMNDVMSYTNKEITINELINRLTAKDYGLQIVVKSEKAKDRLKLVRRECV